MRKVRAGQRVIIAYRGEEIAEIRPLERMSTLDKTLSRLEERGVLSRAKAGGVRLRTVVRKPGALKRFLESRE